MTSTSGGHAAWIRAALVGGLCVAAALALAPGVAAACSTGEDFVYEVHEAYPADLAVEVPIDAPIAFFGTSNLFGELMVEVADVEEGAIVEGSVGGGGQRLFWRPDAPFAPATEYTVHAWTEAENAGVQVDMTFTFTTSAEVAAETAAPEVELSLSKWTKSYSECVEPPEIGSCEDCGKYEVVKTEERMRVSVTFAGRPDAEFGRFYSARVRYGAAEADVVDGAPMVSEWWNVPANAQVVSDDLGLVGSWSGDEVCARAVIWDPRDLESKATIVCAPIGDVNVPSPAVDTDGDDSSSGSDTDAGGSDTDAGASDTDGSAGGSAGGIDDDDAGCGCRSSEGDLGGGALLLGLLGLGWVRRRPA
ncbi:MAG: MYXO-CTERM sorting domain-containing protein [Nannocystaceae bacterium]